MPESRPPKPNGLPKPARQNSSMKAMKAVEGDDEFSIMSAPDNREKPLMALELDKQDAREEEVPPEGFFWRVLAKFK